jgi:hypothetical protein
MEVSTRLIALSLAFACGSSASAAQLPAESVDLAKVKIAEVVKPIDLCPVHFVASDPAMATWTHEGVEYRGHAADCRADFEKDPSRHAAAARRERYILNFMRAMSAIWCPVTDEVTPGGMLQWNKLGYTWESCCAFCDESAVPEDFERALPLLRRRAERSYELNDGLYTEGAPSPVQGAIRSLEEIVALGGAEQRAAHETATRQAQEVGDATPAWLRGVELEATYNGGAASILENRCVECHRPGEIAPVSLARFEDIRQYAAASMQVSLMLRKMPPWPADPGVGRFANDRRLTDPEQNLLLEWVKRGYPRGAGAFEPKKTWVEGWTIGEPDAVFEIPAHTIAAESKGEIEEFRIPTSFAEDRWIAAVETRPGDATIVAKIEAAPFGSYRSGSAYEILPEGMAYRLPAGGAIEAAVHYRKRAAEAMSDAGSRIGVRFAADASAIRREVRRIPMAAAAFSVPAGAGEVEVRVEYKMESDGWIVSLAPVMMERGKSVIYRAIPPGGEAVALLSIPRWDPKFKLIYQLAEPMEAPAGTTIEATAVFNNSARNPNNPDPSAAVESGPAGETFEGWVGIATAVGGEADADPPSPRLRRASGHGQMIER